MKPAARRKARKLAVQAIYSWQLSQNSMSDIEAQFLTDNDTSKIDVDYFLALVRGVAGQSQTLDLALEPFLDRPLNDLDHIEHAVLRLAAYELRDRLDVPYKVAITTNGSTLRQPTMGGDGNRQRPLGGVATNQLAAIILTNVT